ncbi:MAG: DUF4198 domain-containing protein [Desulfobacterales bacterium]|nr:DUF4198 domain-containing protein [Desulfobacterales bacterium]
MKKRISMVLIPVFCFTFAASASAHTLWVNLFDSDAHLPRHVLSTLGYGHTIPLDDLLLDLTIASYDLYDPELTQTALPLPEAVQAQPITPPNGPKIISGDLAGRKIILDKDCKPGVYQVSAASKENYWTYYIDQKGRKKWAVKPMDQVENARKIIRGMGYHAFAVSYFTVGKWQTPKSLGQELEIIPLTDLSDVRTGDLVKFKVVFMGKELTTDPSVSLEYITAKSDAFGGPDKFTLSALLFEGKGQFRMPGPGNWLVNVYTRQNVSTDNALKHLAKKCTTVLYSSSVTFKVNP